MTRTPIRAHLFLVILALTALLAVGALSRGGRIAAHAASAKCPYCKLSVLDNNGPMDNTVTLTQGATRRTGYRCVFCAIATAKSGVKGDLTILAPSEVKGKPVVITRKGGKWAAVPAKAVFVAEKANHRVCQLTYRAFTSPAGLTAHVRKNQGLFKGAKPVSLPAMVALSE